MDDVNICELCERAYEPDEKKGVRKLKEFKGYTVDLRLQQFRKLAYGKQPQFIEFASPKGIMLRAQMHAKVIGGIDCDNCNALNDRSNLQCKDCNRRLR